MSPLEPLTRYTVVAVAQGGDLLTVALAAHSVEPPEQIVQEPHQLGGGLVARHPREAHDVRKQDRDILHRVHVERAEDCPNVSLVGGPRTGNLPHHGT